MLNGELDRYGLCLYEASRKKKCIYYRVLSAGIGEGKGAKKNMYRGARIRFDLRLLFIWSRGRPTASEILADPEAQAGAKKRQMWGWGQEMEEGSGAKGAMLPPNPGDYR